MTPGIVYQNINPPPLEGLFFLHFIGYRLCQGLKLNFKIKRAYIKTKYGYFILNIPNDYLK